MKISQLNVYQKINYYLIFSLALSIACMAIGLISDLYSTYISPIKEANNYENTTVSTGIVFIFWFLFILPNTITIFVHEMRRNMHPKIPHWYTLAKNVFIIFILALVFIPLSIYPLLRSENASNTEFVVKYLLEKRHHGIKNGYSDAVFVTFILVVFCLPLIGVFNWFHAMSWKGFLWVKGRIEGRS